VSDSCDGAGTCRAVGPPSGCAEPWEKSLLLVNEKVPGKEKVIMKLVNGPALTQVDFGDPVSGSTIYDVCIYDDAGQLAGQLQVDRAAAQCAGNDCWKPLGPLGFLYKDKAMTADGVGLVKLLGREAGKSQILIKGKNNSSKGQTHLPTGITAAL
jgi:hypothetical protein